MSVFASKFNPISGKVEWIQMDDAFDYSQQIARSAYADMLHDTDRVSFERFVLELCLSIYFYDVIYRTRNIMTL